MDWQIARKYAFRTLPKAALGQTRVYYGKFYMDQLAILGRCLTLV